MREAGSAYQLHLGEETPETLYRFSFGTVIYSISSHRGVLQKDVTAKLTGQKRNGLNVYKSLSRIDLYFDGNDWSLNEGTCFGAYSKKAKKVIIR